jgi:hypothetical protein
MITTPKTTTVPAMALLLHFMERERRTALEGEVIADNASVIAADHGHDIVTLRDMEIAIEEAD